MRNRDPNSPSRRPRMNAGELAVFVERFTDHLTSLGHSRLTVTGLSDSARHFADWLCRAGIAAGIECRSLGQGCSTLCTESRMQQVWTN